MGQITLADIPLLLEEYTRQENSLPPGQVIAGTGEKLLWRCSKCGWLWRATGNNRMSGCGCPACAHKVATPTYNLAVCFPHLLPEYSNLNNRSATQVIPGTHRKLWWRCSKCRYQWEASGKSRIKKHGCPACAGKVATAQNNLKATHPELAKTYSDWNTLPADKVIAGTHRKLWWRCLNPDCRYEWRATGASRVRGGGCPACANRVVTPTNNLAFVRRDLAAEFSLKNLPLTARQVTFWGCNRRVWWKCACGHEWQAPIYSRTIGDHGCPICARTKRQRT